MGPNLNREAIVKMQENQLLSVEELAAYLGVSTQTIYNRRYRGEDLPRSITVGGRVRYRESDVLAWLDRNADPQPAA